MPDDIEPQEEPVIGDAPPKDNVLLSNGVYDKLMPVAQLWLPALATFYITVAPLWDLPKQEAVSGTIMALDVLLGVILGISNKQYQNSESRFDGSVVISPNENGNSDLSLSLDPASLVEKKEISVRVHRT